VAVVAVGLLIGATIDMRSVSAPPDAEPYHARVREAQKLLPNTIGDWVGEDRPADKDAVKMLRPNVLMTRQYTNVVTGRRATLLLVQVGDARDLMHHYPPVCYVNQGWKQVESEPKHWKVDDYDIRGVEYQFAKSSFDGTAAMYVSDFMIMPDGRFMPDMDSIYAQAADLNRRFYGAAQIQVIPDATVSPSEREAIVRTLVSGNRAIVDAIRSAGANQ
jgi:hypothetical protein